MKSLILCAALLQFVIFALAVPTAEKAIELEKNMSECLKEHNVTEAAFAAMPKTKPRKPEDVNANIKCALHCYLVKGGYMDDGGKFDATKFTTDIANSNSDSKEKLQKAAEKCKDLTAASKCDKALMVLECIEDEAKRL